MPAPSNPVNRPDDIPALLTKLREKGSAEVNFGEVTLHSAYEEIGVVSADAVRAIAEECHATRVVSVLYNTGFWARRTLFFIDNDGTLKNAITLMSSTQTGNTIEALSERDSEFQKIIRGLARSLA
jgi:hypothetical protein